jgi:hypothetical protein
MTWFVVSRCCRECSKNPKVAEEQLLRDYWICKCFGIHPRDLLNYSLGDYQYTRAVYNAGQAWEAEKQDEAEKKSGTYYSKQPPEWPDDLP